MKKSMFSMALLLAMLAGCSNSTADATAKKDSKGQIIATYTIEVDNTKIKTNVYADDLYDELLASNIGSTKLFDAIYKKVVEKIISKADLDVITAEVKSEMKSWVQDAKDQAKTNGVSQDVMVDSLLESEGVETIAELQEKKIYAKVKDKVEEDYYTDRRDNFIADYVDNYYPFHIRGILVKVSNNANPLFNRAISESEAKKLENVFTQLRNGEDFIKLAGDKNLSDHGDSQLKAGGSLKIMDATTGFNNEFKLGIYSYLARASESPAIKAKFGIPDTYNALYSKGINVITATELSALTSAIAQKEKHYDKKTNVVDATKPGAYQSSNIARNVVFNNYFNSHSVSFIEATPANIASGTSVNINYGTRNGGVWSGSVVANNRGEPILVITDENGVQFISIANNPFTEPELTKQYYSSQADEVYYFKEADGFKYYETKEKAEEAHPGAYSTMIPYVSQGYSDKSGRKAEVDTQVKNYINKGYSSDVSANVNFFRYTIFNDANVGYSKLVADGKLTGFGTTEKGKKLEQQVLTLMQNEKDFRAIQIKQSRDNAWKAMEKTLIMQDEYSVHVRPMSIVTGPEGSFTLAQWQALIEYWNEHLYGSK